MLDKLLDAGCFLISFQQRIGFRLNSDVARHVSPPAAHYRERIDDTRLRAVTDLVRAWLWRAGGA